ncbi:hypothetical protein ACIBG7_03570 [Nonomuraea sp. NPDC050328]|uniref:hypothetical protein n=1 Tax=Nonomuraea sp. NPDC050328 TaxID=3364361 RepID=UPI0037A37C97
MPSHDSARDRFRLAQAHLGVLGCLYSGDDLPAELREAHLELRQAGFLAEDDSAMPELAPLVRALAEPIMVVNIEVTGPEGTTGNGAIIGNDSCFVYETWPGEIESEYVPTDPSTLVWSLARVVGLRERDAKPPQAPVIQTTMAAMDAGFAELGRLDTDSTSEAAEPVQAAIARASGLADPELTILTHLLLQLTGNWRVTVAWPGADGRTTDLRGMAVLDCGPLGYWVRERPAEPILPGQVTPDSELRLVFADARELWDRIVNLIPDEIVAAGPDARS